MPRSHVAWWLENREKHMGIIQRRAGRVVKPRGNSLADVIIIVTRREMARGAEGHTGTDAQGVPLRQLDTRRRLTSTLARLLISVQAQGPDAHSALAHTVCLEQSVF